MTWLIKHCRTGWLVIIMSLLTVPVVAQDWRGFYEKVALDKTKERTVPGIEENFRDVIWPCLTAQEKAALQGVRFVYQVEDAFHPFNFHSAASEKTVYLPLSSLRFMRDVCLASAHFDRNSLSIKPLSTYLTILKYQWPDISKHKSRHQYQPLEALGISDSEMDEPKTGETFNQLFSTLIFFTLCHELGHVRYNHRGNGSTSVSQSQANETQADEFALSVMRRIGSPPYGVFLFFFTAYHFDPFVGPKTANPSTHPLSSDRIRMVADNLYMNSVAYARKQANPTRAARQFRSTADQLRGLADNLDDPHIDSAMRIIGYSGRISELRPQTIPVGRSQELFTGSFKGQWINPKKPKDTMLLTLKLVQKKDQSVTGTGWLRDILPFRLTGKAGNRILAFRWQMDIRRFGLGELEMDASGKTLSGWWGTEQGKTIQNGGRLTLIRDQ